jgi:hypothetical protein
MHQTSEVVIENWEFRTLDNLMERSVTYSYKRKKLGADKESLFLVLKENSQPSLYSPRNGLNYR